MMHRVKCSPESYQVTVGVLFDDQAFCIKEAEPGYLPREGDD